MKRFISALLVIALLLSLCATSFAAGSKPVIRDARGPYTPENEYGETGLGMAFYVYTDEENPDITYKVNIDGSEYHEIGYGDINTIDRIGIIFVIDISLPYINKQPDNPRKYDPAESNQWVRWDTTQYVILSQIIDRLPQNVQIKFMFAGSGDGIPATTGWMNPTTAKSKLIGVSYTPSYESNLAQVLSTAFDVAKTEPQNNSDPIFKGVIAVVNPGSVMMGQSPDERKNLNANLPDYDSSLTPFFLVTFDQIVTQEQV